MTRIGLSANPQKPVALELAGLARDALEGRAEAILSQETARALGVTGVPLSQMEADAVVTFGGDGSVLYAAHRTPIPILGVNVGAMGFLAEVEPTREALHDALDRLVKGDFHVEERMRLSIQGLSHDLPDALNEVLVHSAQVGRMRSFEVFVDGQSMGVLRADGLLVATPTGSTSYSMSVGGPMVDPTLDAILLCPIAPFTPSPHALVLGPRHEIGIQPTDRGKDCVVIVDGQQEAPLPWGAPISIYASPRKARLIRFAPRFLEKLRTKSLLPWGV